MDVHECAFTNGQGDCTEPAYPAILHITDGVASILGRDGRKQVRLCATHRRISTCCACNQAGECFNSTPNTTHHAMGLDYLPCYPALTANMYSLLGRDCRSQPGEHDQLHPLAWACICSSCASNARRSQKKRENAQQHAEDRRVAERERRAAELLAQRPTVPKPETAPASLHSLRSTRDASTAESQREGPKRSTRLQEKVCAAPACTRVDRTVYSSNASHVCTRGGPSCA